MWSTGLVGPQHVGSSRTRARACVPCNGRRILNHCATREALVSLVFRCSVPKQGLSEHSPPCSQSLVLCCLCSWAYSPISSKADLYCSSTDPNPTPPSSRRAWPGLHPPTLRLYPQAFVSSRITRVTPWEDRPQGNTVHSPSLQQPSGSH